MKEIDEPIKWYCFECRELGRQFCTRAFWKHCHKLLFQKRHPYEVILGYEAECSPMYHYNTVKSRLILAIWFLFCFAMGVIIAWAT